MESTWRLHIEPTLGALPLEEIKKHTIQRLLMRMADADLGLQVIERVRGMLFTMFDEAADNDFAQKNPARKIDAPECTAPIETRSLTEDEVRRLLIMTSGRDRMIWRILTSCGLRIGEVLALEIADLTSDGLRVDASALNGKTSRTKNGKARVVPITSTLRAELVAWCSMLPLDQTLLFTGTRAQMLRRNGDAVQNMLSEARTAAAIPDLTFRMCRTERHSGNVRPQQRIHHTVPLQEGDTEASADRCRGLGPPISGELKHNAPNRTQLASVNNVQSES